LPASGRAFHREKPSANLWIVAQEAERARIARGLHDEVGQQLALISLEVAKISQARSNPRSLQSALNRVGRLINEVALYIHNLSHRLHPSVLDYGGLVKAVKALCREFQEREAIPVDFQADKLPKFRNAAVALSIYRIVQEGLQNIKKHSHSRTAAVRIERKGAWVVLSIKDSGLGMKADGMQVNKPTKGLGLVSIRERVQLIGGSFRVNTVRNRGTELLVHLPIEIVTRKETRLSPASAAFDPKAISIPKLHLVGKPKQRTVTAKIIGDKKDKSGRSRS
jgi:signal transduction histidine kinase